MFSTPNSLRQAATALLTIAVSVIMLSGCRSDEISIVTEISDESSVVELNSWLVAGMFPSPAIPGAEPDEPQRTGFTTDFLGDLGGEAAARPVAGTKVASPTGDSVAFLPYRWERNYAHLVDVFGYRTEEVCAYLYAEIETDDTVRTMIHVGANDACVVWLGGEEVARKVLDGEVEPSQVSARVTLPPGRTPLLVKVDQAGGKGWGAHVAFFDSTAHPGLRGQMIADFNKCFAYPRDDIYRLMARHAACDVPIGDPEDYITALDSLRAEHPGSWILEWGYQYQSMFAHAWAGRSVEEIEGIARAFLEKDPEAHWGVARAFQAQGNCPDVALAYSDTAVQNAVEHDYDEADSLYARALIGEIHKTRGQILTQLSRDVDALTEFKVARDSMRGGVTMSGGVMMDLAQTYERLGHPDSALAIYMDAIRQREDISRAREAAVRVGLHIPDIEETVQAVVDSIERSRRQILLSQEVNCPLPPFEFETLSHGTIRSDDLAGKIKVIEFWSTECGPCKMQMPILQNFYTSVIEYGNVAVIAVNIGEDEDTVSEFIHANHYTMPVTVLTVRDYVMYASEIFRNLSMRRIGIPLTFVVTPEDTIRFVHMGYSGEGSTFEQDLMWEINTILADRQIP